MIKMITALAAAALAASPSAGEDVKPTSQQAKLAQPDRIVCKRVQDTQWRTASYKVCWPTSKWREIARETQKEYDDYGSSGRYGTFQR